MTVALLCLFAVFAQATGVKVGEVTDTSAIVWARVTAKAAREADGACPGAPGQVRLKYADQTTDWVDVGEASDFTRQFRLTGLRPSTVYDYTVEIKGRGELRGKFETAPPPSDAGEITFAVLTCQGYHDLDHPDGYRIYESMSKLPIKFFIPNGDNVYYDSDDPIATTPALARFHWHRMHSLPRLVAFHARVPGYWIKDDHDAFANDCWPAMNAPRMRPMTFEQGRRIFLEQVPMGEKTYRTLRWGKALQLWLVEGRDFRSPNNAKDGPDKSIWGAEQKEWFKKTVQASDADWKILVSPTPFVGPDRGAKGDNHSNAAFAHEGAELRGFLRDHSMFIVCGDRHWQFHSVDPATSVHEFSVGPASDEHAAGSPGENPRVHRFHRVQGGFLTVTAKPGSIVFQLRDVDGNVVYEYKK